MAGEADLLEGRGAAAGADRIRPPGEAASVNGLGPLLDQLAREVDTALPGAGGSGVRAALDALRSHWSAGASKASESERRGQDLFFGKAQCSACHAPPYYTDNLMHNLRVERFFTERMINGRLASADGPIKTFPLRGIKDSPPYLHDDRLLTLDDTVEFFNLVLELKLNAQEKKDLVAFMRVL